MKTKLLFKAAIVALLFSACSEDALKTQNDENYNLKNEGGGNLYASEQEYRESLKQYFSFNTEEEIVNLTSEKGVTITVDPAKIYFKGRPYTGNVVVEYIEIFGRGEMAAAGLPTVGVEEGEVNDDAVIRPLFTGGEFYVNMTGEEGVRLDEGSAYTLSVPKELAGGEGENSEEMIVWTGEEDEDGDVTWVKDKDENGDDKDVPIEDGKYIIELLSFGWCNIDKLDQIPGEKTGISVKVPSGFDNSNCKIYVAYQGNQNMLSEIADFDFNTMLFHDPHNNFTIGATYFIIFATKVNGPWEIGIQQITVAGNDLVVFTPADINSVSDPALISILNNLP